tara:strand:- start:217 stop:438 length:222 start_codon:yes stop_codon:yes gene_type:complete
MLINKQKYEETLESSRQVKIVLKFLKEKYQHIPIFSLKKFVRNSLPSHVLLIIQMPRMILKIFSKSFYLRNYG